MGMGRNSSRLASRRIATSNKAGNNEDGDDNEAPGDEDWIEPGPASGEESRTERTKGCPSCAKVVVTVAPGIGYSAATRSGAQW